MPPAPFMTLLPALPVMTLAEPLPVPLILATPSKVRFSTSAIGDREAWRSTARYRCRRLPPR